MVAAGAEILDVGAESTRPRQAYGEHPEVDAVTEAGLAVPVVRALAGRARRSRADQHRHQQGRGGGRGRRGRARPSSTTCGPRDATPAPPTRLPRRGPTSCSCTTRTVPATRPASSGRSSTGSARRSRRRRTRGVARDRLIVDPGIGFGKTTEDNLELLHRLAELKAALGGLPRAGRHQPQAIPRRAARRRGARRSPGGQRGHRRARRDVRRGHRARPRRRRPSRGRCASPTRWCGDERRRRSPIA